MVYQMKDKLFKSSNKRQPTFKKNAFGRSQIIFQLLHAVHDETERDRLLDETKWAHSHSEIDIEVKRRDTKEE